MSVDATINRAHQHATNTTRPEQDTGGGRITRTARTSSSPARSAGAREPAGHRIGRSRGGLTTKIHHAVDGRGRPLAAVITGGQRNDGAMLNEVLAEIRVPRPDSVLAERAYATAAIRKHLRSRGIKAVIPEKKDHVAARKRKGSAGGRPPALDAETYKQRNVVERSFALAKQWRALATRYDKLAITYRAAIVLSACIIWTRVWET